MHFKESAPPHGTEAVLVAGNTINPTKALVLLHGRGASAENILRLTDNFEVPPEAVVVAPQAASNAWYPERFIVPQSQNQPYLSAALDRVSAIIVSLTDSYGLTTNHIALAGFSQGACLVAEYLKQHPARYLAGVMWSGGLIGTDTEVVQSVPGSFSQTPLYLGCDEQDFHIPAARVTASAAYFRDCGAHVTERLYTNLGHSIHPEGLQFLVEVLRG